MNIKSKAEAGTWGKMENKDSKDTLWEYNEKAMA